MTNEDKVQHMFITHLLKAGEVEIVLPNGFNLKVGITKENKRGIEKTKDYCWVVASQNNRNVSIDNYNLGLSFLQEDDKMIHELETCDIDGQSVKVFNVY